MNRKGFTLIELIVVIAVLGIIVLIAIPKLFGHTENARIAHIKADVKSYENVIEANLATNPDFTQGWSTISLSELNGKIDSELVYNKKGLVKDHQGSGTYLETPNLKEVKSNLPGTFIYKENEGVFYIDNNTPKGPTEIPLTASSCFEYEDTNENTLRITSYTCQDTYVSIPETHNGIPITEIGDGAFKTSGSMSPEQLQELIQNLIYSLQYIFPDEEVTEDNFVDLYLAYYIEATGEEISKEELMFEMGLIPSPSGGTLVSIEKIHFSNNVKHIGESAFEDLETLNEIEFGNNLQTIGRDAFYGTGVIHLVLPDSLLEMGRNAFARSYYLETLELGTGLTSIPDAAFIQASSLHKLTIPRNIKRIGDSAFSFNSLTNLTIEEGLEYIGEDGFYGSTFGSCLTMGVKEEICEKYKKEYRNSTLTIPESVSYVGSSAFGGGYFETVTLEDLSIFDGSGFNHLVARNVIVNGDNIHIPDHIFVQLQVIEEIKIMGNVSSMGEGAFASITFYDEPYPELVELVESTLPNDYKGPKIMFYGNVDYISEGAFANSEIHTIEFKSGTPISINDFAFQGAILVDFEIPNTVTTIGKQAFYDGNINTTGTIKIPDSVRTIGENAFMRDYGNKGLERIEFGQNTNIQQIGNYAFYGGYYSPRLIVKAPSSKHSMITNTYSNAILESY